MKAKGLVLLIVALMIISVVSNCYAQDMTRKLGRGVGNILTGWIEVPKNIYDTSVESNVFAGLTLGLVKGIGMTVMRTVVGVYETATFPVPLPEDYKPIVEPEFVIQTK
ncbi:MAG: exosortase system-associated protein, TIGR04073 family [Candidatus Omnitrophica bacterium CG07_land_8_20_14_0_80_42_15]|uniref:Exosortase system-associated protein, TIGR04073 family n=1 Tax=Candidatus Aquitaenariimonas noxiae TaxID=1974741 RepID=A0A2J0L1X9_9BACT|nr:MAG: exosortase system-associated protein, TIGR04073 family [Candidatus Omnitrophica bacterium CG07_land_8_20_14_0_80_42_15]